MRFSKDFWKVLTCGIVFIILVVAVFYVWYFYDLHVKQQEQDKINQRVVAAEKAIYEKQSIGNYGGTTPYQTLYLYREAIERSDFQIASTYFVRALRDNALKVLEAASHSSILSYIVVLKEVEDNIQKVSPQSKTFSVSSPISVSFTQVSPKVWEIQSIGYSFK